MSTKAIREALKRLEQLKTRTTDNDVLREARAELEAIEKAARALDEWNCELPTLAARCAVESAFDLMTAIVEQEP